MSYLCGLGEGFRRLGGEPREPHLACDGCGVTRSVTRPNGMPYMWLMDRKPAPKWRANFEGDMRRDYCPACAPGQTKGPR